MTDAAKQASGATSRTAPRISIVLPVFGVEDEIRGCLDSILTQSFTDVEVIAVDDHSRDRSGQILDEYAARDPRVRAIHLGRSGGPGNARNTGLDLASGDYVWFVDADDLLVGESLAVVGAQLARTEPDVLLIGFARLQPSGRIEPNAWRHVLREPAPGEVFTLADRPEVIRLTMTSWSKVIRRTFLTGLGLRFEPGIHEDVPLTCVLLLNAKRIATLDTVCYLYRERRGGALTNTPSDDNFQIFARYEEVFGVIDARRGEFDQFRHVVFDRAIWHYTTVFGSPNAVPRGCRRAFFRRMSEHFARFRPVSYTYPPGLHGAKYRLVERDAYRVYITVSAVNQARIALRKTLRGHRGGAATSRDWPRPAGPGKPGEPDVS
ncbi:MAG TPA: glycosyltransferase [Streptosporangiaceae bacterium]|nr:glycosyltransferase [Streptosporangiaceae bacterium]